MKKKIVILTGALLLAVSASSAQAHSRGWFGFFTHNHHGHYACGHHYNQHGPHVRHTHGEPAFIW